LDRDFVLGEGPYFSTALKKPAIFVHIRDLFHFTRLIQAVIVIFDDLNVSLRQFQRPPLSLDFDPVDTGLVLQLRQTQQVPLVIDVHERLCERVSLAEHT